MGMLKDMSTETVTTTEPVAVSEAQPLTPRLCTYSQLDTLDIVRISENLKMKSNYEGYGIEDFKDDLFMFYGDVFLILSVDQVPTGTRLLIEWMGGKNFYPNRYEVWGAVCGYARQFGCRWIAATNRRPSLVRFYKSLEIKMDTCFMHELETQQ